ncbi:Mobile element protein [Sphingobium indicum BiD32]|uniref:Mobile element protein n=1 Tax=Sphingobium indicum BiD32 TaxID=1301087 RepID=N1MQZ9_9SPHN|nr:Mobile element protein [Sphingobium indicum BiD32]
MHPSSLFSLSVHLERLSRDGDWLEVLGSAVDFERFHALLVKGLGYSDGAKGGRLRFDPVSIFKVQVVQAQHNLADARMEFMIRDRLSWMRFFGFDLGGTMPDENTIRHYRSRLTESGTLMQAVEQQLRERGYLAMGGQIVDATLVPAPKQRNTEEEKVAVKAGRSAKQTWPGKLNKAHQKDVDARWTGNVGGKVGYRPDGTPLPQIATPVFGYKSHISIDRRFGSIRKASDLPAWLGLVPRQYSTGGRQTLLGISKRGNGYVRRLLIHGARSCVMQLDRSRSRLGQWQDQLQARMHINKVVIALADKIVRIALSGEVRK